MRITHLHALEPRQNFTHAIFDKLLTHTQHYSDILLITKITPLVLIRVLSITNFLVPTDTQIIVILQAKILA